MHIGEKIREVCEDRGMTFATLAKRINRSPQALQHLFKRKEVDSKMLKRVSEVLNHDFFKDLSGETNAQSTNIASEPSTSYGASDTPAAQLLITLDGTNDTFQALIARLAKVNAALA